MNSQLRDLPILAAAVALAIAIALHYYWLSPWIFGATDDFDAVHLYIPLASELIAQGIRFFADERSVQAPPFSYIYPALIGPSVDRLKVANAVLSGVTLVLVFRSAALLHSRLAGAISALLFAASPLLRPYLAAPITEASYLFLTATWFWGAAEWLRKDRVWALTASAIAVSLAALTRAPIVYWIIVLVTFLAWLTWRTSNGQEPSRKSKAMLVAYTLALALPAAFLAKNVIIFGFPFYTTGGSNAIYLGNNPLTGGYDPNYLGLSYDVGAIARDQSHLTLEADRLLGGVAKMILAEKSVWFLLQMHLQKLAAFVFVTNAQPDALVLRSWRIALLSLAMFGFAAITDRGLRWLLVGVLIFQLVIHIPVLYTHRYSVGAIDLWVLLAAAVGLAGLLTGGSIWKFAVLAIAATSGLMFGSLIYKNAGLPMPDVFAVGRLLVWEKEPFRHRFDGTHTHIDIPVRDAPWFRGWNNHVLVLEMQNESGKEDAQCLQVLVSYKRDKDTAFSRPVSIGVPADKKHRVQVGAIPLGLNAEGTVRLSMDCTGGVSLSVKRMAIYAALGAIDYRERLLGEKPILPVER